MAAYETTAAAKSPCADGSGRLTALYSSTSSLLAGDQTSGGRRRAMTRLGFAPARPAHGRRSGGHDHLLLLRGRERWQASGGSGAWFELLAAAESAAAKVRGLHDPTVQNLLADIDALR